MYESRNCHTGTYGSKRIRLLIPPTPLNDANRGGFYIGIECRNVLLLSQSIKTSTVFGRTSLAQTNMLFNDGAQHHGEIQIRILNKKGRQKLIWQEYKLLHFLRKNYGLKLPKLALLTGYFSRTATYANLLTTSGKGLISNRINGDGSPAAPIYMAIGTGTTASAAGNTTLETESTGNGYDRMSGTAATVTTTTTDDTNQLLGSWTVTSSKAVTEMGVLNAASSGTLFVRNVFSAYTLQSGDTFEITHRLKHA